MRRILLGLCALAVLANLSMSTRIQAQDDPPEPQPQPAPVMSDAERQAIIDRVHAAVNSGQLETFLKPFAAGVQIDAPMGVCETKEEVEAWAKWHIDRHFYSQPMNESWVVDDTVAWLTRCRCDQFREMGLSSLDYWVEAKFDKDKQITRFQVRATAESENRLHKAMFVGLNEVVFNQRHVEAITQFISPHGAIDHDLPADGPQGVEAIAAQIKAFQSAFPDARFYVEQMVAEGDFLMGRSVMVATHQGDFMGMKASNRRVVVEMFDLVRFEGLHMMEHWSQVDGLGLVQQIMAKDPLPTPQVGLDNYEPTTGMSTEKSRSVARTVYRDVISGHNLELAEHFIGENVLDHGADAHGNGLYGFRELFEAHFAAFPDLKFEPAIVVAEGDMVGAMVVVTGTHKGEFMGIKPTDREINVKLFDILRLAGNKVVERWGVVDRAALHEQLTAEK